MIYRMNVLKISCASVVFAGNRRLVGTYLNVHALSDHEFNEEFVDRPMVSAARS